MFNNKKIIEFIKKMWIKLWGKDLPKDITEVFPDNKFEWYDQVDLYNRLKKRIAIKRFFISLVIIVISYFLLNYLFNSISFLIKNNPTIACWNKPVCIYSSKKLAIKQDAPKFSAKNYENLIFIVTEKINFRDYKSKFIIQVYDTQKDKFIKKIKINCTTFPYKTIIPISQNEILFYSNNKENDGIQNIYNIEKNIFRQIKIDLPIDVNIVTNYRNGILFITNNSKAKNSFNRTLEKDNKLSKKETLLFLDFSTLKVKTFPEFEKQPKFLPQEEDIIVLDNGKIIIPIRINRDSFFNEKDNYSIWDHIEIYLPEENKFIALMDTKPLEDNLFNIKLNNNDILFINLKSTYIFKNKENKFVSASIEETERNKFLIENLNSTLDYVLGEPIINLLNKKHKFIQFDEDKFLVTCGRGVTFKKDYMCYKTVYLDYGNLIVEEGPHFLYPHRNALIATSKKDKNKTLVIGGYKFDKFKGKYRNIVTNRVQVIKKSVGWVLTQQKQDVKGGMLCKNKNLGLSGVENSGEI